MASTLGTNYGEKFARNSLRRYFESALSPRITNKNWEGTVKGGRGDRVNILAYGLPKWEDYTGADITFQDVTEVEGTLVLDKQRSNSFRIKDWDKFKTFATDVESSEADGVAELMKQEIDAFNLGFYTDAGSRVSDDYATGTITVTAAGAVTGAGTAFTAAMVGSPFTISGKQGVFVVTARTSNTAITIADMDDPTTYSGGAVAAGTGYVLEQNKALQATAATIDDIILKAKERLSRKGVDGDTCPRSNRFIVVPTVIESILLKSNLLTPYTPSAREDHVKLGIIGMYRGFKVYVSEEVQTSSETGGVTVYHCLAGHKKGITHAFVNVSPGSVVKLENNFGKGYKQLVAYGSKVLDVRRKNLCDVQIKL